MILNMVTKREGFYIVTTINSQQMFYQKVQEREKVVPIVEKLVVVIK